MKTTSTLLILGAALLLSSCSSWQHADFSKRKYMKHFRESKFEFEKEASAAPQQRQEAVAVAVPEKGEVASRSLSGAVPEKAAVAACPPKPEGRRKTAAAAHNESKPFAVKHAEKNIPTLASTEQGSKKAPAIRAAKAVKVFKKAKEARDGKLLLLVILCFIPLGAALASYLHHNEANTHFWITLILCFTYFGGIIFGLLCVLDAI